MSEEESDFAATYKLDRLEELPPPELRSLLKEAVGQLKDLKFEFEEF